MKRMWLVMASALLLMLVLAACGGGATDESDDTSDDTIGTEESTDENVDEEATSYNADEADKLYQQSCASCHGGNLEGLNGPPLDTIGSDYSQADIKDIIVDGKPGMPAGLLEGDDADNVAAWLADKK